LLREDKEGGLGGFLNERADRITPLCPSLYKGDEGGGRYYWMLKQIQHDHENLLILV